MTIHLLVEGPSERALLETWIPRLVKGKPFRVHPHQGKGSLPSDPSARPDLKRRGLLDQLPAKLRGYATSSEAEPPHIVVLVDADEEDPKTLMERISQAAAAIAPKLSVTVCLAVEETEAFYLGDLNALEKCFPDANMKQARAYVPDSVCGTWEFFGRIVGDGGGNKVAWAEAMAPVLTTDAKKSRSPSFKVFVTSLRGLETPAPEAKPRRPYRHLPKPGKADSRR